MVLVAFAAIGFAAPLQAQDKSVALAAPPDLIETGLLAYALPRFALKHGIRVTVVAPGDAGDAALTQSGGGVPVFRQEDRIWYFVAGPEDADSQKLLAWLTSDVGKNTVASFETAGTPAFSTEFELIVAAETPVFDGNAALGETLSLDHCGRCHVVNETNRMKAIGSTPSFAALRSFDDWDYRFQVFFTLNPHPSFTQIQDVTDPFPANAPSPIHPLMMSMDDLEAILAYVAQIEPADLGAPIRHQ